MRTSLSIVLEDLLVARTRFAWAKRRQGSSRSKAAMEDAAHHRAHLVLWGRLALEQGGEQAATQEDVRQAQKAARARTKHDRHHGCLCGQIVGVTGECPARGRSVVPVAKAKAGPAWSPGQAA